MHSNNLRIALLDAAWLNRAWDSFQMVKKRVLRGKKETRLLKVDFVMNRRRYMDALKLHCWLSTERYIYTDKKQLI